MGKNYIFAGYAGEDATMAVSGKNPKVGSGDMRTVDSIDTNDAVYQQYLQAAENPVETEREHMISSYDVSRQ